MPAFGLLRIDFGHGFDALPGQKSKTKWKQYILSLDNNFKIDFKFSKHTVMKTIFISIFR
jgi:hypothetical protein